MTQNGIAYELLLVDDFSSDDSWTTIKQLSAKYSQITGLKLAQNYGQWSATLAGMSKTKGQFIVTIDDDMEYDLKTFSYSIKRYWINLLKLFSV